MVRASTLGGRPFRHNRPMPQPEPARRRPRAHHLLWAAVGAGLAVLPAAVVRPVSDPSPWLHLTVGRFLIDGGRFGMPDPWAPFAAHAYVPTQWLPSVVTSVLYDRWGLAVVAWERGAGIGILALLVLLWLTTVARPAVAVVVTVVTMYAAWPGLTERPQLAGLVLLVPVLAAWLRTIDDHRPRWWLVPLTWVAACTHGIWSTGTALGGLVVLLLVTSRAVPVAVGARLFALVAACLAAAACTPIGPKLLLTPFTVGAQGRQFVQEWLPASIRSPHVLVALAMLGSVWLLWVRRQRRPAVPLLAVLVVGIALVLTMQRTVPVGALVAAPLLALELEGLAARSRPSPSAAALLGVGGRRGWAVAVLATLVGVGVAIPVAASRGPVPTGVPIALERALRTLPANTRVVSDGDLSGWLLFTAGQVRPVFDLRIESYSADHVRRFIKARDAEPGWTSFISDTGATAALLPSDSPLGAGLSEQLGWVQVGSDAGFVLWKQAR
jgi:hypothetical protein